MFIRILSCAIGTLLMSWPPVVRAEEGDCAEEPLEVYLDTPGAVDDGESRVLQLEYYAGEAPEIEVAARLRSDLPDEPGEYGIWSFAVSVVHDGGVLEIVGATGDKSDAKEYLCGFESTETVDNETGTGFVGVRLSCSGPEFSFPPVSDVSLVHARYTVREPIPAGTPVPQERTTEIALRDGLQGSGQPVDNVLTYRGGPVYACTERLTIHLRSIDTVDFIRGDANFDGLLDISDPVTILHNRFGGNAAIHCDDAADANDDSAVDISDAIYMFSYLFLGGEPPVAPFPGKGADPTEDDLRCRPESRG